MSTLWVSGCTCLGLRDAFCGWTLMQAGTGPWAALLCVGPGLLWEVLLPPLYRGAEVEAFERAGAVPAGV